MPALADLVAGTHHSKELILNLGHAAEKGLITQAALKVASMRVFVLLPLALAHTHILSLFVVEKQVPSLSPPHVHARNAAGAVRQQT